MPSRSLGSASMQLMTPSPQSTVSTWDLDALGPRGNGPRSASGENLGSQQRPGFLTSSPTPPSPSPTGCPTFSPRCTAHHSSGWPRRLPGRIAPLAALLHEPPLAFSVPKPSSSTQQSCSASGHPLLLREAKADKSTIWSLSSVFTCLLNTNFSCLMR